VEFLEHIKVDLFPDQVYVFTPKGKILNLPQGATCVDFAYAVHSDIGNRCIAAKVNHELVPLRTRLQNGDQVEIVTAAHSRPNPTWLSFVTTGKARSHIRHFLKTLRFDESVMLGERLLGQSLTALGMREIVPEEVWEKYLRENGQKTREEVLADVGLGQKLSVVLAKRLLQLAGQWVEEANPGRKPPAVTIRGTEGMAIQFARCCQPIPGDPILGFVKKDQGLIIHTHDCPVLMKNRADADKLIDVEWDHEVSRMFDVTIRVLAANVRGTLASIAATIAESEANVAAVTMQEQSVTGEQNAITIQFTLQVNNRTHLAKIMRHLRQMPNVYRIARIRA